MAGKRRYALIAAALIAITGTIAGVAAARQVGKVPTQTTTLTVDSTRVDYWSNGTIHINAGDTFSIATTGTANWDTDHPAVDANGLKFGRAPCADNQYKDPTSWAATGINCYSVIGRILGTGPNQSQVIFLVGTKFKLKSPVTGDLQLGFNDDYPYDNSGSFSAAVTYPASSSK